MNTPNTTRADVDKALSRLIDGFLIERKARGMQPRSIEFYRAHLRRFEAWASQRNATRIDELSPAILRAFLLDLEATGHKRGGVHAFYRSLRAFLKWYQAEFEPADWSNPVGKVRPPKVPIEPLEPIPPEDVRALLNACKGGKFTDERDRAVILTLLDTGARAGELLRLDFADCNAVTGDLIVRKGKGGKPRTVFVGKQTRRALRAYFKQRADNSPALFVTTEGERLTYDGLRAIVTRRAKLAGIQPPPLHAFRRTFALNMLRNGADVLSISRLLGHGDLQMMTRYVKQNAEDLRDVHAKASPADKL